MLQDSLHVVTPVVSSPTDLILYVTTAVAGVLSGVVLKALHKASDTVSKLSEVIRVVIIGVLSFAALKVSTLLGLKLPENPLGWDATAVNTFLSTLLGWAVTKIGLKKTA